MTAQEMHAGTRGKSADALLKTINQAMGVAAVAHDTYGPNSVEYWRAVAYQNIVTVAWQRAKAKEGEKNGSKEA
ncbi:MAG: hypothetical protein E6Q97_01220 [Desulfurellales bacterium]|nr:MAG: hypothetical protein E6Q97_01220 [Desulfurellales bacterium]